MPEAVRLGTMAAQTNNLNVLVADIGHAYLYARTKDKLYTILEEEYGVLSGKTLMFNKSPYDLKIPGARFHGNLSDILRKMGFKPSKEGHEHRL